MLLVSGLLAFGAIAFAATPVSAGQADASSLKPSAPAPDTSQSPNPPSKEAPIPSALESSAPVSLLAGIELGLMRQLKGGYSQTFDNRTVFFTVNPELQGYADDLLKDYEVPAGAAVLINSHTGRVIALSQQRRRQEAAEMSNVALDPSPPAASLFKIVTTAALVEKGIPLTQETCYAGGSRRLMMQHLLDPLPKNRACVSLTTALGRSINAVFAKLSDRYLNRSLLREYAKRFGFNRRVAFDIPVKPSSAEIPADRLERARTAAGFWHTHLSPLHAAVIAQSLAQKGAMLKPYIVDRVEDTKGGVLYKSRPQYLGHTVSRETAEMMTRAMVYTTRRGTARKSFRDPRGRPFVLHDVSGKTGTLTGQKPYRAYTWFVGLAPAEDPEVAIAVLVVNEPKWRIKAPQLAAMLLKKYFEVSRKAERRPAGERDSD